MPISCATIFLFAGVILNRIKIFMISQMKKVILRSEHIVKRMNNEQYVLCISYMYSYSMGIPHLLSYYCVSPFIFCTIDNNLALAWPILVSATSGVFILMRALSIASNRRPNWSDGNNPPAICYWRIILHFVCLPICSVWAKYYQWLSLSVLSAAAVTVADCTFIFVQPTLFGQHCKHR